MALGLNTGQRKAMSAPMEEVSQGARQVSGPQSEAEYREEGARLLVSRGQVCLPSLGVGQDLPQKETGELGSERHTGINEPQGSEGDSRAFHTERIL